MRITTGIVSFLAALVLTALPTRANAQSAIDGVGTCLTDNTNGRDRKELVRWIFIAISQHPEIRSLSAVDDAAKQASNQAAGELFTRLIAEDCGAEIGALIEEHGASAMTKPFEFLGSTAMQELMNHPDVGGFIDQLENYTDQQKIQQALTGD